MEVKGGGAVARRAEAPDIRLSAAFRYASAHNSTTHSVVNKCHHSRMYAEERKPR